MLWLWAVGRQVVRHHEESRIGSQSAGSLILLRAAGYTVSTAALQHCSLCRRENNPQDRCNIKIVKQNSLRLYYNPPICMWMCASVCLCSWEFQGQDWRFHSYNPFKCIITLHSFVMFSICPFIVKEDVMDCINQGAKRYERLALLWIKGLVKNEALTALLLL